MDIGIGVALSEEGKHLIHFIFYDSGRWVEPSMFHELIEQVFKSTSVFVISAGNYYGSVTEESLRMN